MSDREYPSRPIVGVGAVTIVHAHDYARLGISNGPTPFGVVLIKRRFEPLAAEWSLPGGTVEVGETLEAAIAREVAEETGLAIAVGAVIEVFDRIMFDGSNRAQYHFVLIDYLCVATGGTLAPGSDVSDAVIVHPSAVDPYKLTDKALAVIARGVEMHRGIVVNSQPPTPNPQREPLEPPR
jgi:ADP-ribose pyrophosphatase